MESLRTRYHLISTGFKSAARSEDLEFKNQVFCLSMYFQIFSFPTFLSHTLSISLCVSERKRKRETKHVFGGSNLALPPSVAEYLQHGREHFDVSI